MAHAASAALVREYAGLTWQLFDSIAAHANAATTNASVSQPLPHQVMSLLDEKDKQVAKAIRESQEHLAFQQRIDSVKAEIKQKENLLLNLADKLRSAEQSIEAFLRSSQSALPTRQEQLDVDDVVAYARKLCYTTSAPPGWRPDMPLRVFRPPAPQEGQMRASILYRELPDAEQNAAPPGPSPNAPHRPFLPPAAGSTMPQLFPSESQTPAIPGPPPGWSATNTDSLLFNIPPPPPDWKPGDPIVISEQFPVSGDVLPSTHQAMNVDLDLGSDDDDD